MTGNPANDLSLPHARGGVSWRHPTWRGRTRSSPRSWGCFQRRRVFAFFTKVFPTLVGVFLLTALLCCFAYRLPHARGGVSWGRLPEQVIQKSSPRSWGCFCQCQAFRLLLAGLPHARGGVSRTSIDGILVSLSSPRSWGCFPSFTVREAYDSSLPHARGGVSCVAHTEVFVLRVFPTLVGVFLPRVPPLVVRMCLPHARGGVSALRYFLRDKCLSSPRSWGCFWYC